MSKSLKENNKIACSGKKPNCPKADLADYRIITKNLVYVIGLSSHIANKDILMKFEYFGQYGTITKIVVNRNKAYNQNNPHGPSFSAYVTYSKPSEASVAILSLDDTIVDNHLIRASFGTTKYCTFFLKNIECINKECLFLHKIADEGDIISREDLNTNKNIFIEQQLYAIKIADIYNPEVKKKLMAPRKGKTTFPSSDLIYRSEIVIENDPIYQKSKSKKKFTEDRGNSLILCEEVVTTLTPASSGDLISSIDKKVESNETTSTSSKDDLNYTSISSCSEENIKSFIQDQQMCITPKMEHRLFIKHEHSRFGFICEQNMSHDFHQEIEIPQFVQNIISKKTQTYKLTKYIKSMDDTMYKDKSLEHEYENKNSWAMFLVENKVKLQLPQENTSISISTKEDDKDLIDDFEKINCFILNKCRNYK